MQIWPWCMNEPNVAAFTACSMSASSSTISASLPPSSTQHFLSEPAGFRGDLLADGRRAREADAAHGRVRHQLVADLGDVVARARDDVEHAFRYAGFLEHLGDQAGRPPPAFPPTASARSCCRPRAPRRSRATTRSAGSSTARSPTRRRAARARRGSACRDRTAGSRRSLDMRRRPRRGRRRRCSPSRTSSCRSTSRFRRRASLGIPFGGPRARPRLSTASARARSAASAAHAGCAAAAASIAAAASLRLASATFDQTSPVDGL